MLRAGGFKSIKDAIDWYRKSADQGFSGAQFNLGVIYDTGKGVPKDKAEAARFYLLAAEQGVKEAMCNLGCILLKGASGIEKNEVEAVRWFKNASDLNCPYGQNSLASCYLKGRGIKKDKDEAFRLYKLSAEQGYARARQNLSLCYEKGKGVPVDKDEAERWLKFSESGFL